MIVIATILGLVMMFLGLASSACVIYLIENKRRGELWFR